ncbi:hypothetical protein Ciccas_007469 [Cichlidogyrus casuarinus]|uniref:Phosphofurin acidic cluster sorting protein 1/2 N-terminal C2 domain-containing protein n=1 Tax=Cichlidogyrus casuarinus TaxID=1844966 RepID=A0ABD2Q2U7_9PLAT
MKDNPRRVLRFPEIPILQQQTKTTQLESHDNEELYDNKGFLPVDFACSLIYSHSLRFGHENILQILMQRRRYKNKPMIPGFRTFGYCNIDLDFPNLDESELNECLSEESDHIIDTDEEFDDPSYRPHSNKSKLKKLIALGVIIDFIALKFHFAD